MLSISLCYDSSAKNAKNATKTPRQLQKKIPLISNQPVDKLPIKLKRENSLLNSKTNERSSSLNMNKRERRIDSLNFSKKFDDMKQRVNSIGLKVTRSDQIIKNIKNDLQTPRSFDTSKVIEIFRVKGHTQTSNLVDKEKSNCFSGGISLKIFENKVAEYGSLRQDRSYNLGKLRRDINQNFELYVRSIPLPHITTTNEYPNPEANRNFKSINEQSLQLPNEKTPQVKSFPDEMREYKNLEDLKKVLRKISTEIKKEAFEKSLFLQAELTLQDEVLKYLEACKDLMRLTGKESFSSIEDLKSSLICDITSKINQLEKTIESLTLEAEQIRNVQHSFSFSERNKTLIETENSLIFLKNEVTILRDRCNSMNSIVQMIIQLKSENEILKKNLQTKIAESNPQRNLKIQLAETRRQKIILSKEISNVLAQSSKAKTQIEEILLLESNNREKEAPFFRLEQKVRKIIDSNEVLRQEVVDKDKEILLYESIIRQLEAKITYENHTRNQNE